VAVPLRLLQRRRFVERGHSLNALRIVPVGLRECGPSARRSGVSIHQDEREKTQLMAAAASIDRIKKKLPERLAEVRGSRSQRQFARELGVFQQNVNRYENGTTPHADFLITLAVKENVSLDWLLLGKGRARRGR
jgi:transcriptional regulator with XRE-family HTH domain